LFACMSGHETRSVTSPFKEAEATAIMGGIKLDFANVTMDGDQATLDVTIIMGGIDLYVPPDWNVNIQALPLLGAAVDKRRPSNVVPTKTLTIRGTILMGGLEIKN
jgi:predicted membrane protein